ncbi:MAG: Rne/Rng family ribonuclease [Acidobacteria bacterium]|nr:Rne/Rng family ribonuclease [Acidobacteriota bacterium]
MKRRRRRGRRGGRGRGGKSPAGTSQKAPGNGENGTEEQPIPIEALEPDDSTPVLELLPEPAEGDEGIEPRPVVEVEAELDEPEPSRSQKRRLKSAGPERTIVVNDTSRETRIAILEKGALAEIFIERENAPGVVGNVYKGKVSKVLPGMQSAFVDIGLERDAFLYVSDISPGFDDYEGPLNLDDVEGGDEIRKDVPKPDRRAPIQALLKEGQELLVQVTKEGIGTKGARITSYVTIAGRFLVLMPQVDHVGVSRKIGDARERARLRKAVEKARKHGLGFVIRTVADSAGKEELEGDVKFLTGIWEEIRKNAEKVVAPALVRAEMDPLLRILRDHFNAGVNKVVVDSPKARKQAVDFLSLFDPADVKKVHYYDEELPVFDKYGVQAELDKALKSKVWLKSGGYIVINQTEALVAVDVNTGKFVGRRNLEETVLKTNLEAVGEIVRQLRLRDLGGIIVVDFIDMEDRKNRRKLNEAFEKELMKDRARTKVLQISDFGLVEITRQRTKKSLERLLTRSCPYCTGTGKVKSNPTVLFEVQREIRRLAPSMDGKKLVIRANPEVAAEMELERGVLLEGLGSRNGTELVIKPDPSLHHEHYDIVSV